MARTKSSQKKIYHRSDAMRYQITDRLLLLLLITSSALRIFKFLWSKKKKTIE